MSRIAKAALAAALSLATASLVTAPAALAADEAGFIAAVESLDHYATGCPGCAQEAVSVGYRACRGFDLGGSTAAVQAVKDAYNADTSEHREYYATLFAQYASMYLCPQHQGEIGQI